MSTILSKYKESAPFTRHNFKTISLTSHSFLTGAYQVVFISKILPPQKKKKKKNVMMKLLIPGTEERIEALRRLWS